MRLRTKMLAGLTAGLLALGVAACEADPGALDDPGAPGIDDGIDDGPDDGLEDDL